MIYYSSTPSFFKTFLKKFSNSVDDTISIISSENNFTIGGRDCFFVPIQGDDELSLEWYDFFIQYSKFSGNIGKTIVIYFFGIYDSIIDNNSFILKQINFLTKYLSLSIHVYPIKLSKFNFSNSLLSAMIYYVRHIDIPQYSCDMKYLNDIIFYTKKNFIIEKYEVTFIDKDNNVIPVFLEENYFNILFSFLQVTTKTKIILSKNILKNFDFKNIINKNVKYLYLSSTKLNDFSFHGFSNLQSLHLSANDINKMNVDTFPKSLKYLNISKNKLEKIEKLSYLENLERISLFNNNLKKFNTLNSKLFYLNIGCNPIQKFPKILKGYQNLRELNISFTNIDFLPKWIIDLNLTSIDITGLKITNNNIIEKLKQKRVKIIC